MRFDRIVMQGVVIASAMLSAAAAHADNSPLGLWIDHTGRGGVEITDCGGKLCGHVAWLKDNENADQCGKQIIGNVKPVGTNKWDNGWIYDPDRGSKYDVEVTALNGDKLKVMGYSGSKWLSETYTWKRAPADLQKCGAAGDSAAVTEPAPAATTKKETAKAEPSKPAVEDKTEKVELDPAASDADKPSTRKSETAKTDTTKAVPDKPSASSDTAEADDDTSDEPKGKKGGKVLARIMDELESGDGPVKLKRSGKKCKVDVPYVGVVSFDCDK
jgi:uncharacterized protein (DUF2147 family)